MPAHNAALTITDTYTRIPPGSADEVIVVDDKSSDATIPTVRELPVHLVWHPHNVGYGGNQKTCYLEALQRGADVVVMLHPDGQYDPALVPALVEPIANGEADVVLGSRFAEPGLARSGGMPRWKWVANRFLTIVENSIMGTDLSELHTGYRAYSREFLMTVPFLRNSLDFVFDTEILMQARHFGFRIAEVPAHSRYFEDASSVGFRAGTVYGLKTLWTGLRLVLHRRGVWRSRRFQA
jgi:glycosyltransferase involved in cell wall biosynthesis